MKAHTASLINAIILIAFGLLGYFGSATPSFTSLIPTIIGVMLLILNNGVKLEFVETDRDIHYQITPYNFSPKLAKKIVNEHYIDLGQGILDMLNQMHGQTTRQVK